MRRLSALAVHAVYVIGALGGTGCSGPSKASSDASVATTEPAAPGSSVLLHHREIVKRLSEPGTILSGTMSACDAARAELSVTVVECVRGPCGTGQGKLTVRPFSCAGLMIGDGHALAFRPGARALFFLQQGEGEIFATRASPLRMLPNEATGAGHLRELDQFFRETSNVVRMQKLAHWLEGDEAQQFGALLLIRNAVYWMVTAATADPERRRFRERRGTEFVVIPGESGFVTEGIMGQVVGVLEGGASADVKWTALTIIIDARAARDALPTLYDRVVRALISLVDGGAPLLVPSADQALREIVRASGGRAELASVVPGAVPPPGACAVPEPDGDCRRGWLSVNYRAVAQAWLSWYENGGHRVNRAEPASETPFIQVGLGDGASRQFRPTDATDYGPREIGAMVHNLRRSGSRVLEPPPAAAAARLRNSDGPTSISARVCLDEAGLVTTVESRSGDDEYDALVKERVQQWTFTPFIADGKASAVCGTVFILRNCRQDRPICRE